MLSRPAPNKKAVLTLASPDAIEAICNFWKLRENNKDRNVSYRYVTTSKVGREKNGFANQAGIENWNICRISDAHSVSSHIEEIKKFLLGRNLGATLTTFLRKSSPEEIQSILIQPFEWVYHQPGLEALRFSIIARLHEKGAKSNLSPREADKLAIDLYTTVQERAATKNPQPLTYWEMESRIGHANYVEVPRPQLEALQSALLSKFVAASGQGDITPDIAVESEILVAPVVPPGVLARKEVNQHIVSCLESGILVLHGGSGTGKTIAIRQAIPSEVIWVSLRDKPDLETQRLIQSATRSIITCASPPTVVLEPAR